MSTKQFSAQRLLTVGLVLVGTVSTGGCHNWWGSATSVNNAHTISGTISGLGKDGLVLANGSDTLTIAANATTFTMPGLVHSGDSYDITVAGHPVAVQCTVTNGSGAVASADVTDVSVDCGVGVVSTLHSFSGQPDGAYPYWADPMIASDGNLYGTTYEGGANGAGAVIKITPDGVESVLYSFTDGNDGGYPLANLVEGANGNFYGTSYEDGANGGGVLFELTPDGVETTLHAFGGSGDGSSPYGSVVLASDGYYYGTTYYGGASGRGTVFRILPDGSDYSVVYSFAAGADGQYPAGSLIQASDGNLYGTTYEGGANGNGAVFKLTLGGSESVLYSFAGGADGAYPYPSNLIQAADGDLYGMTYEGGANNAGTAYKLTLAGVETVLHSFGAGSDGTNPYGSLLQASDGNFYGMTYEGGDNGGGTVFEMTADGTETVLYSFTSAYPLGSLIETTDHNLVGFTYEGGDDGRGQVFVLN